MKILELRVVIFLSQSSYSFPSPIKGIKQGQVVNFFAKVLNFLPSFSDELKKMRKKINFKSFEL